MFKKSNRNFRTKKAESESDEEQKNVVEQVTVQKQQTINKTETKIDSQAEIKQTASTQNLKILSFNDDDLENEEETSEFKVKKSKESRRLVKEVKKSKKDKERALRMDSSTVVLKSESSNSNDILYNDGIKVKPLKINEEANIQSKSKYLVNKYRNTDEKSEDEDDFENYKSKMIKSEDESSDEKSDDEEAKRLEILRKEMEILNGNDADQIENERDETKRSMKLMLKSGIIPDASLIHAVRKKREMARQGDYIPIGKPENGSKSRLVREDDDNSDDDLEDKKRVSLNYREIAHKERQETRQNFLAYEEGSDVEEVNEEEDDEMEKWEKEQIRKGVLISQALPSKLDFKSFKKEKLIEIIGKNEDQEEAMEEESRPLDFDKLSNLPQISFLTIKDMLKSNLKSLEETCRAHQNEHNMTLDNLNANKTEFESLKTSRPVLDEQYIYFQETKAYIRDFVDCYNEKIVEIEKGEAKMLALFKQKAEKMAERFQQDIRDQNFEATNSNSTNKKTIDPAHQRRMNEREQRRAKRRKTNEKITIELNDVEGLSTDDEENQTDENVFKQKKDDVLNQLYQIQSDIAEDFYQYDLIKERLEKWKKLSPSTYRNAYVSLSLPKLFSPLVRYEIIDWNPLENTNIEKLENFKWFTELITYNKQDLLRLPREEAKLEDDHLLVPHIVEKTVLPKLISIAENVYNPMSSRQSINFAKLVLYLIKDFPTVNYQSQNTKKLIEAVIARLRKSIDQDIFVPLYPKQLIEQTNSESSIFFRRQFWSCIKLFSNILKWKEILSDSILKELSIDRLLNRYLMIAFQNLESNMNTIYKIEYLIKQMPSEWFFLIGEVTLSQTKLLNMCNLIKRIAESIYENEFKTKKIETKEFRDHVLRISKLLSLMGAHDHAILLTNQFENKL